MTASVTSIFAPAVDGRATEAKRQKVAALAVQQNFYLTSPLLQGKNQKDRKTAFSNLAPFWAVPRCGRAFNNESNMALKEISVEYPNLKATSDMDTKTKTSVATFKVTCMVNTATVYPGEVLCLPFF